MFVKKSYEVEAFYVDSFDKNTIAEISDFIGKQISLIDNNYFLLETLEGKQKVHIGNFIIKGVNDEFYPVDKDNFHLIYKIKTKVFLTVSGIGKTYLNNLGYENTYDFDEHTLDYKYDRTGFEHLTNEEFKSLPNRKIKEGWFDKYVDDFCKLVDSNKYDVITGWIQKDFYEELIKRGYEFNLIVYNPNKIDVDKLTSLYKTRGNNKNYLDKVCDWLNKVYIETTSKHKDITYIFNDIVFIEDFLLEKGFNLNNKQPKSNLKFDGMNVFL